jgi:alkylation response protein AidB-like acyl-CoA dehydrogenase
LLRQELGVTDARADLIEQAARIGREELGPRASELDRNPRYPHESVQAMQQAGFPGVLIPAEYGGTGMSLSVACKLLDELAQWCSGTPLVLTSSWTTGFPLQLGGSEEAKRKWLPAFAAGTAQGCFAVSERSAGNDVGGIQTAVRRDGDGWVINGEKWFAGNAEAADVFLIAASMSPGAGPSGTCIMLVERGTPGLEVGEKIEKMGLRGAIHSPITLHDVRVPADALLAESKDAFRLLMRTLDLARPLTSAACLGIARAALSDSLAYATERHTFGRPISDRQQVQRLIAEMAIDIEAGSQLTYPLAEEIDANFSEFSSVDGPSRFTSRASMAKLFTSRMVGRVTNRAVQIHGAAGYVTGTRVERLYRDARGAELYEGTSEIHELLIARELLRSTAGREGS